MTNPHDVDRAFVRLAEGLVHYRHAGASGGKALPLYMVHAGPGSSAGIAALVAEMGKTRWAVAPDTLGNGDSAAPGVGSPDLGYYADSVVRVMDALKIEKADYFGTHTGAHIGVELLLRHPGRIRRAIFDGIGIFPDEMKTELLANYAPNVKPDEYGRHMVWAWNFVRDQMLHFPYFMRDPAHRLSNPMLPPEMLHAWCVEVLKSLTTYHNGYHAVFRHATKDRLAQLEAVELLFMAAESDPLCVYLDEAAAAVPSSKKVLLTRAQGLSDRIAAMTSFLDA